MAANLLINVKPHISVRLHGAPNQMELRAMELDKSPMPGTNIVHPIELPRYCITIAS